MSKFNNELTEYIYNEYILQSCFIDNLSSIFENDFEIFLVNVSKEDIEKFNLKSEYYYVYVDCNNGFVNGGCTTKQSYYKEVQSILTNWYHEYHSEFIEYFETDNLNEVLKVI